MQQFVSDYAPLIIQDHLLRLLYDAPAEQLSNIWQQIVSGTRKSQMVDRDLWLIAAAAEMLGANANAPSLVVLSATDRTRLQAAVQNGVNLFQKSRTSYPGTQDFSGAVVGSASYFNGDFDYDSSRAYSGYTGSTFPTSAQANLQHGTSWDVSHFYRVPVFLRALYDNRKATGISFPVTQDVQLVTNQFTYKTFQGDFTRPLLNNYFDGSNGWYNVSIAAGTGYSPAQYCNATASNSMCLIPGSSQGWGLLAFFNDDLMQWQESILSLAGTQDPGQMAFRDRYYNAYNQPFVYRDSAGNPRYPSVLLWMLAGAAEKLNDLAPAPAVSVIGIWPNPVAGGNPVRCRVNIATTAPAGGTLIQLSSGNPNLATLPVTATIPAGQTYVDISVGSTPVRSNASVVLTAVSGSSTQSITLNIVPPALSALNSPASVLSGKAAGGSVYITGPAPAGGFAISMASSNQSLATVPASVTIPAGAISNTFLVDAGSVPSSSTVTISATDGKNSQSDPVTILPPVLSSLSVPSSTVGGKQNGGGIGINAPAPSGGLTVTLTSSNPAVFSVPASVVVPAGGTSVGFSNTSYPVASNTPATVTARTASSSLAATVTVVPATVSTVVLPSSIAGGKAGTGAVKLNGPAVGSGYLVSLISDNAAVKVPASVTVPAGTIFVNFPITTTAVQANTVVTVTATAAGVTQKASLTVTL
jgi:hypothetical protein